MAAPAKYIHSTRLIFLKTIRPTDSGFVFHRAAISLPPEGEVGILRHNYGIITIEAF